MAICADAASTAMRQIKILLRRDHSRVARPSGVEISNETEVRTGWCAREFEVAPRGREVTLILIIDVVSEQPLEGCGV